MKRRILSLLLAVMLVSSAIGPVGVASAKHECGAKDVTLGLYKSVTQEVKDQIFGGDRSGDIDDNPGMFGGCDLRHGSTDVSDQEAVDRAAAKQEIVSASATAASWAEDDIVGWNNTVQGVETEARLDGLAAYGRALDNGSSKAAAKSEAKRAATEYVAVKQENLIQDWNRYALAWSDYDHKASTEGIPDDFVRVNVKSSGGGGMNGINNGSHPLVTAGETVNVVRIDSGAGGSDPDAYPFENLGSNSDWKMASGDDWQLTVAEKNGSFETIRGPTFDHYTRNMKQLRYAEENVTDGLDTYIDQIHADAEAGDIDWSQAVGASAMSKHFASNGSFQSWAALKLRNMQGVGMPENMSEVGYHTVSHDGSTMAGVLLSDGNPQSGAYERGETYDGSVIEGPQYVVGNSSIMNLDGQFTIEDITNDKGETVNKTVINNITYETSDTEDLQRILEANQKLREDLEAREEALRNQTVVAPEDSGPNRDVLALIVLLILVGAVAVAYMYREQNKAVSRMVSKR